MTPAPMPYFPYWDSYPDYPRGPVLTANTTWTLPTCACGKQVQHSQDDCCRSSRMAPPDDIDDLPFD